MYNTCKQFATLPRLGFGNDGPVNGIVTHLMCEILTNNHV